MEFACDEKFIHKKKMLFISIFITAILCLFLMVFLTESIKSPVQLEAFAGTIVILSLIFAIEVPLIFRSMRKMKLLINEDSIIKRFKKGEQCFSWNDVVRGQLTRNPKGNCISIKIYGKDKAMIYLIGFERMNEIVDQISKRIPGTSMNIKQYKLDYENPIWIILPMAVTMIILTIIKKGSENIEEIFSLIFFASLSIVLFVGRPISKSNPGWKKIETIIAWLLILSVFLMLIGMLMSKLT